MEHALRETAGVISAAARMLGCTRNTIKKYMREDFPNLLKVKDEIKEDTLDLAEGNLLLNIKDRHPGSIFFYLKTQGQSRGYIERQQIQPVGKDGNPVDPGERRISFDEAVSDETLRALIASAEEIKNRNADKD